MAESAIVTITSKNMIVIPKAARERFNLREGQKLQVTISDDEIIIAPTHTIEQLAGILKGPRSAKELIKESRKNISRYD